MLHLQPRIHLHKVERHGAIGLLLHNEFDRAGTHVVDRARRRHCRLAHLFSHCCCHAGCRRFFQYFLMSALHRAIALKQIDIVAVCVAKHLYLDVARALHILLDQHRVVAKTVDGFAFAGRERRCKFCCVVHGAHALAAAPGAGLDQDRVADGVGLALEQRRVLIRPVVTRHQRHTGQTHQPLGFGLEPHGFNGRGWRTDEHQAGIGTGLRELFVLAQKAVARMYRLRAGGFCRL